MPRSKYAKVNKIDKLHRQQKANLRQEHLDSHVRAAKMVPLSFGTSTGAIRESVTRSDSTALTPSHETGAQSTLTSSNSTLELPYSIQRTLPSQSLPIYESAKSGGTKHITTIRKLDGNLNAMRSHLLEALGLEQYKMDQRGRKKENVTINWRTKHLIVRGWKGPEVKKWAEMIGL